MPRRARIGSRVTTVMLVVAFTLFLVPAVGRATGRVRFVPILSGSMSPTMQPGSAAIATREPVGEVQPGQIIVYTIPVGDRHVSAHRVMEVDATSRRTVVVTKGDANEAADPWRAELQGDSAWVVRGSVPFIGRVILWLSSPLVLAVCFVGGFLAALAAGFRRIWAAPLPPESEI